jgi:hypothetical protein
MAYGDGFVNNLLYVFYCDAPEKKKEKSALALVILGPQIDQSQL